MQIIFNIKYFCFITTNINNTFVILQILGHRNTQVITLPIIDSINPRPPFLPLALPEDLVPRLNVLHGDPVVWWIGQFLKYMLRPQPATSNKLGDYAKKVKFQKPIVG